jgi:hypothetical protein
MVVMAIEPDIARLRVSSKVRWMRVVISLAMILTMSASVMAGAISITSPDHPQTFAYGQMIWHQLYLNGTAGELVARITFSNLPYAGDDEARGDESFDFRFPGVQLDPARRTFFARNGHGELIPVARFRERPACGWIDLAPGAKMYLLKESGRVTATLTTTNYPRVGSRWIEMDNNFSLQNLLCALFGEFRGQPEN